MKLRPMLASKVEDLHLLTFPMLASPKLDGVRAMVVNEVVMSRNLKPIPSQYVQRMFAVSEFNGLDGELIVGDPTAKDAFSKTTSGVMSTAGTPNVVFHVFDNFISTGTYLERAVDFEDKDYIKRVPQFWCHSVQDVLDQERFWLQKGYEGIMLRAPNAPYKFGRSTLREQYLLKLKRFEDSEAQIIDYEELMHNANEATTNELGYTERSSHKANQIPTGTLGALVVRDVVNGWVFKIGTGFTETQRQNFWTGKSALIGKIVKYRYQPTGMKDLPRFPSFQGFRDTGDL